MFILLYIILSQIGLDFKKEGKFSIEMVFGPTSLCIAPKQVTSKWEE